MPADLYTNNLQDYSLFSYFSKHQVIIVFGTAMKKALIFGHFIGPIWLSFSILLLCKPSLASEQKRILPLGFNGSQMNWIDNGGLILLSNNSLFGFGFNPTPGDVPKFLLVTIHIGSSRVIWSANRNSLVSNADKFSLDDKGNAFLQKDGKVVWSTDTSDKGVSAMELQNSGNLVLLGKDGEIIWQSFSHPTDTLLSNQDFTQGMRLVSDIGKHNLSYFLEIKSGDMFLYAGFQSDPQPYWSMGKDYRTTINKGGGVISSASISANSWRFYSQNRDFLWQFTISDNLNDPNSTWIAVLGKDGLITFYDIQNSGSSVASSNKIPRDYCSSPLFCDPYLICYSDSNKCQCPSALTSNCQSGIFSPCDRSNGPTELVNAGAQLGYFALGFVSPFSKTHLDGCKNSCIANCSCLAVFFQTSTGNCFLFDNIGSFQNSQNGSDFVSFVKVLSGNSGASSGKGKNRFPFVVIIVVCTVLVICGLVYAGFHYLYKKKRFSENLDNSEDDILEGITGVPIRFTYHELQTATNNFSVKLGQGGFGSVYQGSLQDGTRVAVKKLEGIGQGKKEFRAEVSIIGSIHHVHLVRLKGFCAEGTHRLLAYEYMENGSLDKWIFKKNHSGNFLLDWDMRFNIALGTAKGLAYLHEDCDSKIIHCDIKPENVLLDENYEAKVSDFGLAKLMTREQSHVFTTLRGTRGYLAPEWIMSYAISEKSDVYSYGMVLLEIIGGRKNFDPTETSEKSYFPSYAFKMIEEGKLRHILDSKLPINENDARVFTAIKVALWCIQEDMGLRPPMTKVVQMLEGLSTAPQPPLSSPLGSRMYSSFFKSSSEGGTSSGPSDCNSDAYQSAVQLSGPR